MNKRIRRVLIVLLILLAVLLGLPYLLPVHEGGIAPAELVTDPDGAFLTLQNVQVYYEDQGSPDAPVLLLIHGLFGSTATWRYNVDALAGAGYRVITFDRPGFGLSDKVATFNYSVSNQATLTAELMDALDIATATIIGHSAGGNVAVHFAHQYPERTARLVLVDAAALAGGPPAFVGSLVAFGPIWRWGRVGLQAYFTRPNLENTLKGFYVDSSFVTEADYDLYWRAFQTPGWDLALLGLTRDGAGSQLGQAAINAITAETLILWGAQDNATPLNQGETLVAWLPNSQLVVLPDAGHQAFEEKPDAFNTALLNFLGPPAD